MSAGCGSRPKPSSSKLGSPQAARCSPAPGELSCNYAVQVAKQHAGGHAATKFVARVPWLVARVVCRRLRSPCLRRGGAQSDSWGPIAVLATGLRRRLETCGGCLLRLDQLTPAHVLRAIDLYMELAWPPEEGGSTRIPLEKLRKSESLEELVTYFEHSSDRAAAQATPGVVQLPAVHSSKDKPLAKRYSLRLGNHRYPFMKFVVQEYLVLGEYFFSVDTHDKLDLSSESEDHAEWQELRSFNRAMAASIEESWQRANLPTNRDLRALVEELARVEREESKRARILVVDDEANVAFGLRALLQARGYQVELAHDGRGVLERLERDPLPDLLLLDYEMPYLDGDEVLRNMRSDPRLAQLPVLLATARDINLAELKDVSGFLRKPYARQILFKMIARLLEARQKKD